MNNYKIELLNELSNILSAKMSPLRTMPAVEKLFNTYLETEKVNFVIWDNNNMRLKDFVKNTEIGNTEGSSNQINYAYTNFAVNKGEKFYFNESEFKRNIDSSDISGITELIGEKNYIIYPLISNGEVFGLINFVTAKKDFDKKYFEIINISSMLISGAIINYILNEQMEISLNFYKAMKDIAKIIESQYELSYIIPLIGEMIDRFISSHLIYIFIYKDEKFELIWPNACKDEKIHKQLQKLTKNSDCIISKDSRIGIFPIENEDNLLGAIVAYSNIEKLSEKNIDYLIQLTRQSGLTIQRANSYAEVLKYATLDALTGLNNRRQFEIRLKQEVSNSKRNKIPLCCMMLDVDYFKKVNDTYGHAAGDCVLKKVSDIIKSEIREYDIACRYGGEEFFIILPQTNIKEASFVAQRLRKVIEKTKINIEEANVNNISFINITVSIGVCAYNEVMEPYELAQKADKALYKAKASGRNRVIIV